MVTSRGPGRRISFLLVFLSSGVLCILANDVKNAVERTPLCREMDVEYETKSTTLSSSELKSHDRLSMHMPQFVGENGVITSISVSDRSPWVHHAVVYQNYNPVWSWEHTAENATFEWPPRVGLHVPKNGFHLDIHVSETPPEETYITFTVVYAKNFACWSDNGGESGYFLKSSILLLASGRGDKFYQSPDNSDWLSSSKITYLRHPMMAFAVRVHAHAHGRDIVWNVLSNGKRTELYRRSAQEPQIFVPLDRMISLAKYQQVEVVCNYIGEEITIGPDVEDEMCNLYIMGVYT